jgi:vancomycin resistance protein VanW
MAGPLPKRIQRSALRHGSWRSDAPQSHKFEVFERDHEIRHGFWGGYSRHNALYRKRLDGEKGVQFAEEFITGNHAILMYEPLLPAPENVN